MSAFETVLSTPCSVSARRALLAEWKRDGDPRTHLLELQLLAHAGLGPDTWDRVPDEIRGLIRRHGKDWAGDLEPMVNRYRYELGLVTVVNMNGDSFIQNGVRMTRLAPVTSLVLDPPLSLRDVAAIPALAQIRALSIVGGAWITDEGIEYLVRSPYVGEIRTLQVSGGALTERGVNALASARFPCLIYIDVSGNPGADTARLLSTVVEGRRYILGSAGEQLLGEAIADSALGYSGQVSWPPPSNNFLFDNDA